MGRGLRRSLGGRLCPNALLTRDIRYDDVTHGGFVVVSAVPLSPHQRDLLAGRGTEVLEVKPGSALYTWLADGKAVAALVRPDFTVLKAGRDVEDALRSSTEVPAATRLLAHAVQGHRLPPPYTAKQGLLRSPEPVIERPNPRTSHPPPRSRCWTPVESALEPKRRKGVRFQPPLTLSQPASTTLLARHADADTVRSANTDHRGLKSRPSDSTRPGTGHAVTCLP